MNGQIEVYQNETPVVVEQTTSFQPIWIILIVFVVLAYFMEALGRMKTFEKMNISPWKAWIPFYGDYVMFSELNLKIEGIIIILATLAVCLLPLSMPAGIIAYMIRFGLLAHAYTKLSNGFNKSAGFLAGLILCSPVFLIILGFNDDYWNPKQPKQEVYYSNKLFVLEDENGRPLKEKITKETATMKYKICPFCGANINEECTICPECKQMLDL